MGSLLCLLFNEPNIVFVWSQFDGGNIDNRTKGLWFLPKPNILGSSADFLSTVFACVGGVGVAPTKGNITKLILGALVQFLSSVI